MDHLEIEVKFRITDIEDMRHRLISMGANRKKERVFETNYRYDTESHDLLEKKSILRLRKDREAVLTFKSQPDSPNEEFKIHKEIEVRVDDFDKTAMIVEAMGFKKQQVYEKWRETFEKDKTEIVIDSLPYGHFIEIEGQPENIRGIASRLGLDWDRRILVSYLELFARIKAIYGLPFSDITFDHFTGIRIDIARVLKNAK